MTQSIDRSSIIISPNRQRQEFDPEALTDLTNSIDKLGLFHPPVLRSTESGMVLVAGERRLRAMDDLAGMGVPIRHNGAVYPPGTVPYTDIGDLSPIEAEEAELDENLKRKDLTWQEHAAAVARLHKLRSTQAALVGERHTIADTATELKGASEGSAQNNIRQEIIVAEHLDNPEVAKAKTAKDAFKVLKRQEESRQNVELAERIGKTLSSSSHSLIHGDCLEWLDRQPDGVFDVLLTDPPYGMGADSFGDGAGRLGNNEHHYADTYNEWLRLHTVLATSSFRVCKPQAHAYIFCDFDRFHELKSLMQEAGWYVFRTPLINYKPNSGRVPLPEHGPRRQYEICLYAIKGKKTVTAIYSDVISTRLEEALTHGAQKPVELYVDLLRRSCRPGDLVLDCFAGSGTIFPAAHQLKVIATGIEVSSEYFGMASRRLEELDTNID
jgi:site-specific DNA-methyltransferase (adenine-specific)